MSEQPVATPRHVSHAPMQERLRGFRSSRKSKMFGIAEVVALAGSCLILLLVLVSYLYFLVPARSRLTSLQADRARLQTNLRKAHEIVNLGSDTKKTADAITVSLDTFENSGLVRQESGRMALYGQLNQLMLKNALRNTSGPSYSYVAPAGAKSVVRSASTKWQSVYPGIAVAVTVEGQYQNVRHFLRDIENSKQFIIINQVELQRATENNSVSASSGESVPGSRGSLVSLQLNMVTYFQRSNAENDAPSAGQN